MWLTEMVTMLFQRALTLRLLVCFPFDHCQRVYKDQVTTIVFLLVLTRCSSVDRVGIPLRIRSFLAIPGTKPWMLIHSGTTMSQLPLVTRTGLNMKPWRRYLQCGHTHWAFLAIITFT